MGEYYACGTHRVSVRGAPLNAEAHTSRPKYLLGAEMGLQALAKFLEASGAFTKTGRPRRETERLVRMTRELTKKTKRSKDQTKRTNTAT
ncbi:hypothetical protein K438DRAFT_1566361 [Mycena galopus ATCC 62051]|nr:hypothetical protein K438DRAFT_1566361 [Mycena galopus ATCC 62051]